MCSNLSMGLRADVAREILECNDYTKEKYAYRGRAVNDGSGYLYALTGFAGGFAGNMIGQAILFSANWLNNSNYKSENSALIASSTIIGGFLGIFMPFYILYKWDNNEFSEAEQTNKIRKSVLKIIDDNYQDCSFHRPLKGKHVSMLLELTDVTTQKGLLDILNGQQVGKLLNRKGALSEEMLKLMLSKIDQESFTNVEWKDKINLEKKSWTDLKTSLLNNNEEEIGKSYAYCKEAFGGKTVDAFVKKYLTYENLKSVYLLSSELSQCCQNYYQNHKREIDSRNFFG